MFPACQHHNRGRPLLCRNHHHRHPIIIIIIIIIIITNAICLSYTVIPVSVLTVTVPVKTTSIISTIVLLHA